MGWLSILCINAVLINLEKRQPKYCFWGPPKLLDQLRRCLRDKHYSLQTSVFMCTGQDSTSASITCAIPQTWEHRKSMAFCRTYSTNGTFPYQPNIKRYAPCCSCISMSCRSSCPGSITSSYTSKAGAAADSSDTTRDRSDLSPMIGTHLLIAEQLCGTGMRLMECARRYVGTCNG